MTIDLEQSLRAGHIGWEACLDHFADIIGGRVFPAHPSELERVRWHVCCRACRRGGHRDGCPDCQDRTRAKFGQPHPDDFTGTEAA